MFLLFDVDNTFSIIPAKSERLMLRNDREIEFKVYTDRIVIVRKNDVIEKGGAVKKMSVDIGKPPQRPQNAFISRGNFVV